MKPHSILSNLSISYTDRQMKIPSPSKKRDVHAGVDAHLFERMGMPLILTFILTRIPLFRQLLDRKEMSGTRMFIYSCLFGLFGILGVYAGVVVENGESSSSFWLMRLTEEQALAHSALVGVVIGGLIGGPRVGIGAGFWQEPICCISAATRGWQERSPYRLRAPWPGRGPILLAGAGDLAGKSVIRRHVRPDPAHGSYFDLCE